MIFLDTNTVSYLFDGDTNGDADILIAAIVIANDGRLVSHNLKHYDQIKGLRLADWRGA